jgi:hypothetical protein
MQSKLINYYKTLFVCLVLVSCGKSKEDEKLFEELNHSLENSNAIIKKRTEDCLRKLEIDSQKPVSREKASIWLAKAKVAESLSDSMIANISSLQKLTKTSETIEKSLIEKLYNDLILYKHKLLQIDERIAEELGTVISMTNNKKDSSEMTTSEFCSSFNKSNSFIKTALLKNKVEIIKENVIEYCSLKVVVCILQFEVFQAIASQNSTHFKPNETLEITAGIGAFSKAAMPIITVDGKPILLNADGVAEYKTKVTDKKGKFSKLVKIEYRQPDGTAGSAEKEIIYTVDE